MQLSRRTVAVMRALGVPLVHAVLPWWLSTLGARHGWGNRPGGANLAGLVAVAIGSVALAWASVLHARHLPPVLRLGWHAPYFIERGPYAISRNPMYVAELTLWLGWAALFGSVIVTIGLVTLWLGTGIAARAEERLLASELGETYARYRDRVPRWLHLRKCRRSTPSS